MQDLVDEITKGQNKHMTIAELQAQLNKVGYESPLNTPEQGTANAQWPNLRGKVEKNSILARRNQDLWKQWQQRFLRSEPPPYTKTTTCEVCKEQISNRYSQNTTQCVDPHQNNCKNRKHANCKTSGKRQRHWTCNKCSQTSKEQKDKIDKDKEDKRIRKNQSKSARPERSPARAQPPRRTRDNKLALNTDENRNNIVKANKINSHEQMHQALVKWLNDPNLITRNEIEKYLQYTTEDRTETIKHLANTTPIVLEETLQRIESPLALPLALSAAGLKKSTQLNSSPEYAQRSGV